MKNRDALTLEKMGVGLVVLVICTALILPITATNKVYLIPQQSNATYCNNATVEIWVNASNFVGGEINFTYNPTCANVTKWVRNISNFQVGSSRHYDGREYIDFYTPPEVGIISGEYMIGTLTIHCVNNSQGGCETSLTFVEPSTLRNVTHTIPATWINGTFTCGELQQCLGTCCNYSNCTDPFATNVTCNYCVDVEGKYWKPNKDSACFDGNATSNLCLGYCPQCCDSVDNDYDGSIDYPRDGECTCGLDPSEWEKLPPVPELPTIFLFLAGLLTLTGYVLWKKRI